MTNYCTYEKEIKSNLSNIKSSHDNKSVALSKKYIDLYYSFLLQLKIYKPYKNKIFCHYYRM